MNDFEAHVIALNELLGQIAREHEWLVAAQREHQAVSGVTRPETVRAWLAQNYRFEQPMALENVVADVGGKLRQWGVQVTHPRYFGLFNPTVPGAGVVGDALTAHLNPQLATWSHSVAATEIERHLIRFLAPSIGFDPETTFGCFTTGGQESNLTAVILALTHQFPTFGATGLRGLDAHPLIYLSAEGHHSFHKIAHATGLGRHALRIVPVESKRLRMDVRALRRAIEADRPTPTDSSPPGAPSRSAVVPAMIVATAGTTTAGAIDPLSEIADVAAEVGAWLHVDAAWGGAAALVDSLRPYLGGIERADSVTWDAHKWLSVPMGAGLFFSKHPAAVEAAFAATTGYMPAGSASARDPYSTSLQWSRRFIGLKLFLALAEIGAAGLAARIERQAEMGRLLREKLIAAGFFAINETPLPVVCFSHPQIESGAIRAGAVASRLHEAGRAWISKVVFATGRTALRACITSYLTDSSDLDVLIAELAHALST